MGFICGLDLGQAHDPTALVILEQLYPEPMPPVEAQPLRGGRVRVVTPKRRAHYQARHLERFPLGTSYPAIITEIKTRLEHPALAGATLVVDGTGVGRPVVDMFREAGLRPVAVTITSGVNVSQVEGYWHVPKVVLVSTIQVLLQSQRLKVARELPDGEVLSREMQDFKTKVTAAANDVYGSWREGTHDDLLLAAAVAAWYAENRPEPAPPRPPAHSQRGY